MRLVLAAILALALIAPATAKGGKGGPCETGFVYVKGKLPAWPSSPCIKPWSEKPKAH